MTKKLALLVTLLLGLTLCQPAPATAQRTWPQDSAGRPAPPCVTYDPVTNTTVFCPPGLPAGGAATSATADPGGYGRTLFVTNPSGPDCRLAGDSGIGNCGAIWLDANTVMLALYGGGATMASYISINGGRSYKQQVVGSVPNGQGNFASNLIRFKGLYFAGTSLTGLALSPLISSPDSVAWIGVPAVGITSGVNNVDIFSLKVNTAGTTALAMWEDRVGLVRKIFRSTDGVTWSFNGNTYVAANTVSNSSTLTYVGGTTWMFQREVNGEIFRSTNDGISFASVFVPSGGGSGLGTGIVCPTTTICIASSLRQLLRSTNGGATWQLQTTLPATDTSIFNLVYYGSGYVGALTSRAAGVMGLYRSNDNGATWQPATAVTAPVGYGNVNNALSNGAGGLIVTGSSAAAGIVPLFGYVSQQGQSSIVGLSGVPALITGTGLLGTNPGQGTLLMNSQNVSAANTPISVTLTGIAGQRITIRGVQARCAAAGTSGLTITDNAVTVLTTAAGEVLLVNYNLKIPESTGLSISTGSTAVITLATCGAGNTGTLIVQADQS